MLTRIFLFLCAIACALHSATAQSPFITSATEVVTTHIELSTQRTTVIILPAAVAENGVDRGSAQILAKPVDGVGNVIKVKAASDSLQPTNLTIFTTDGRVYRFDVSFSLHPVRDFFDFASQPSPAASPAVRFLPNRMDDASILKTSAFITELGGHRKRPASNSNGAMKMRVRGIYLSHGVIFFQLGISNGSGVPFEIDFIRCYQRDRRKIKRKSQMEKEVKPLSTTYQKNPIIGAFTPGYSMVLAFEKFTIADDKYFMIEAFEKNGDRHLAIKVVGDDILKAQPILGQ